MGVTDGVGVGVTDGVGVGVTEGVGVGVTEGVGVIGVGATLGVGVMARKPKSNGAARKLSPIPSGPPAQTAIDGGGRVKAGG